MVPDHPFSEMKPNSDREAAELLQIKLLDHIIIGAPIEGRPGYFSFKEAGVL